MTCGDEHAEATLLPALFEHVASFLQTDCTKAGHRALVLLERLARQQRANPISHEHLLAVMENRLAELAQMRGAAELRGHDTRAR